MKRSPLAFLFPFIFSSAVAASFPDCSYSPPPNWNPSAGDPVFVLSQDYPATAPSSTLVQPWKAIDFHLHPAEYMQAVIDYCYEGNLAVQFRGQANNTRKWYHAPWLHPGPNGREFTHGLTGERVSRARELAATQTSSFHNFAVGLYNAPGGFAIGRVWADPRHPDASKAVFPEGTVTFKLLFTTATKDQVPYLDGSPEWIADTTRSNDANQIRNSKVRLLQIDIAVKDNRSSEGGWIFGTFQFDQGATAQDPWRRLTPVTLMWGNDPTFTPANYDPTQGHVPQQSWINPNAPVVAYRSGLAASSSAPHVLGWAGRGNGPVDNSVSSCLSCHSVAEQPKAKNMLPSGTDQQKLHWFRNLAALEPFDNDGNHKSLDFSLQLALGLDNQSHSAAAHPFLHFFYPSKSSISRDPAD
ncbi:MAG: hypothetical protein ABI992_02555 [Chthoniobacterales bacterium]